VTSIESAVSEFILACEADGLKDSTIRWHRSILGQFAARHPAQALKDITTHDMREYLVGLRQQEYSPDSVADYTRSLHRFWKWAALEYEVKNPMRSIRYPDPPKPKTPKVVPLETIILMFRAAEGGMNTVRDQAILAFALDTGCRAGGICTLRAEDVDLFKRRAIVVEKGDKTRSVPFTKVTAVLLARWMEERQPVEVFFYSLYTWEALRPNSLYLLFKRLARRAGVRGKFNPHGFRHTFGKEYVKAGGDIFTLARIMGHENVNTTAGHYAIFTSEEVADAQEKYSPVNQLFKEESEE